jgi:hypothetical protein
MKKIVLLSALGLILLPMAANAACKDVVASEARSVASESGLMVTSTSVQSLGPNLFKIIVTDSLNHMTFLAQTDGNQADCRILDFQGVE